MLPPDVPPFEGLLEPLPDDPELPPVEPEGLLPELLELLFELFPLDTTLFPDESAFFLTVFFTVFVLIVYNY